MKRKFKNTMEAVFYLINRLDGTECELDVDPSTSSESSTSQEGSPDSEGGLYNLHVYGNINGYTTDFCMQVDTPNIHSEDDLYSWLHSKGKLLYYVSFDNGEEFALNDDSNAIPFHLNDASMRNTIRDMLVPVSMQNGGDSFYENPFLLFIQYGSSYSNFDPSNVHNNRGAYTICDVDESEYNSRTGRSASEDFKNYDGYSKIYALGEASPRMGTSDINNTGEGLTVSYESVKYFTADLY